MSGGSFNYLFLADDPADASRRYSVREMAEALEQEAPDHPVTAYTRRLAEMLHADIPEEVKEVWKGIEWTRSSDWGQDQLDEVLEQTKNSEPSSLLTADERLAIKQSADLWKTLNRIVGREATRDPDLTELIIPIHLIQRYVMAQAAARAHPEEYRLLGELGAWDTT